MLLTTWPTLKNHNFQNYSLKYPPLPCSVSLILPHGTSSSHFPQDLILKNIYKSFDDAISAFQARSVFNTHDAFMPVVVEVVRMTHDVIIQLSPITLSGKLHFKCKTSKCVSTKKKKNVCEKSLAQTTTTPGCCPLRCYEASHIKMHQFTNKNMPQRWPAGRLALPFEPVGIKVTPFVLGGRTDCQYYQSNRAPCFMPCF